MNVGRNKFFEKNKTDTIIEKRMMYINKYIMITRRLYKIELERSDWITLWFSRQAKNSIYSVVFWLRFVFVMLSSSEQSLEAAAMFLLTIGVHAGDWPVPGVGAWPPLSLLSANQRGSMAADRPSSLLHRSATH